MAFTSFRDTLERMRNDLASGNWRVKSYDNDGMQREFFSPAEFMQMLDYVEYLADLLIAAELEQRVKIVEMLNKDGLIAGLEERLDRLKKEDDAHEKQSAA